MLKPFAVVALLFVAAVSGADAASPQPPKLRLSTDVKPVSYAAKLELTPTEEAFSGEIEISVELQKPSAIVWLNATGLEVQRAEASIGGGTSRVAAKIVTAAPDFIGLQFAQPLPKGPATLKLAYTGKLSRKDSDGAFAQKEGDDWYVFTQFEAIDARRAFPCFDEPSFKVPWQLTLTVPQSDKAFSNTPELSTVDAGNGKKRVTFAQTKPLPSYLVAFAVGPFDIVDAGKSRVSKTPIRILTLKGMASRARYAKESTAELLARLEEYFGSHYPYEKLDLVTVPFFSGAMENVGLITYGVQRILQKPEDESISFRRSYASLTVHELAHQWFGNLVTTAWWDDLWLNEAFASWMSTKMVEEWQPGWGKSEDRVASRGRAMGADSLVTARKIRQPILSNDDMSNAFDGITYAKGEAVLFMTERWLGADVFQRGVQRYMKTHAHGTAVASDFLAAMSAEAKRDVAPTFSSFLDQPGVPLVTMKVRCDGEKPRLELEQERYLPLGSPGSSGKGSSKKSPAAQVWQLPVCVEYGLGMLTRQTCELVSTQKAQLPLTGCPDRLLPNLNGAGYYRAHVQGPELTALFEDGGRALALPARLGALDDLRALVWAGKLSYGEVIALVPKLANDPNRHVVESMARLVAGLRDAELVPENLRPAYARFIRDNFGARARALGWSPKKGEDEETMLLRNTLVPLVASQGEDATLQNEAKQLAATWVAQRKGVDPELLDSVLDVAGRAGDKSLHAAWLQAAAKESDLISRRRLIKALGAFEDPALAQQNLELTLGETFDVRESVYPLLWGALRSPRTRPVAWSFVTTSFEPLVQRLPRDYGSRLPWVGSALCDAKQVAQVEKFFRPQAKRFTGGPRELDQALESMRLCVAFKKAQAPSVAAFFQGQLAN